MKPRSLIGPFLLVALLLALPGLAYADGDSDPVRLQAIRRAAALRRAAQPRFAPEARLDAATLTSRLSELLSEAAALPPKAHLVSARVQDGVVDLAFSAPFAQGLEDEVAADDRVSALIALAEQVVQPLRGLRVSIEEDDGHLVPLSAVQRRLHAKRRALLRGGALRAPEDGVRPAPWALRQAVDYDPAERLPYGGALAGKTIVVSPGHGWMWDSDLGRYRLQRGEQKFEGCGGCRGITEDLSNAHVVHYHLLPMLERAGARVKLVRERDLSVVEVIVDDSDEGYHEEGGAFGDGNSGGGFRDTYRTLALEEAEGVATWPLEPLVAGYYDLSIRYRAGDNRSSDALYRVHCAGEVTDYSVNQRESDDRWLYLGSHWCAPGQGHFVELMHGPESDGYLIPDAVRLGGGMDADAGHPRWEMSADSYVPYLGAPASVTDRGDVTIRPAYANWEGADLYVSVHSNAGGGSGFSTYRYNCYEDCPSCYPDWSHAPDGGDCDDPPGSARLQEIVHEETIRAIQGEWDPAFRDVGTRVANFGEVRVLDTIPGVLLETAFHDQLSPYDDQRMSDNQALHDPRWRHIAMRGVLRGVVRFLAGDAAELPPERPQGLVVLPDEDEGVIRAHWDPVEGAIGYRVYRAVASRAFDQGTVVEQREYVADDAERGTPYYLKVSALGPGGESLDSEVGGARLTPDGAQRYEPTLIVQGFDRRDAWVQEMDNTFAYVIEHGEAITAAGPFPFGSASNEAFVAGSVDATAFGALDWILGEEATEHRAFDEAEMAALRDYLTAERGILATGSEILWDMEHRGSADDIAFMEEVFGAGYLADDAEVYAFRSTGAGAFADMVRDPDYSFDDGTHGTFDVDWPDVLELRSDDASVVLEYSGDNGPAAVAHDAASHRALLAGFPFEAVYPVSDRMLLMYGALRWLLPPPHPPITPDPDLGAPDLGPADLGVPDLGSPDPDLGSSDPDLGTPDSGTEPQPDLGAPEADLGGGTDSGASGGPTVGDTTDPDPERGCSCRLGGEARSGALAQALLVLGMLLWRRRTRAQGGAPLDLSRRNLQAGFFKKGQ